MDYFNMVCDGCGREVQGYNIVNGMKFCAKCYQEIFGNKNMTENLKNMYEAYLKILNEKDQQIAELEEQLKNAIVPKFKYGQDVWCVYPTNEHRQGFVFELEFVGYTKDKIICCITENEEFEYDEVFETKAEAEAKLRELKGEGDVKD